jgi:Reverse transcriptase (RNA-dependent DNA polymerase)/Endonuclease-reverse transcriptase
MPDNYNVFRKDRPTPGGGVLIGIKPHLKPRHLAELDTPGAEIIWVEYESSGEKYLLASAYRAPSASASVNEQLIQSMLNAQNVQAKYKGVIICGDFNLDISWSTQVPMASNTVAESFLSGFYDLLLSQLILEATRITPTTRSILDLFLCNDPSLCSSIKVIPGVSDHLAILATIHCKAKVHKFIKSEVLCYSKANWEKLSHLLCQRLPIIFINMDINEAWAHWKSSFWHCVDECIPKATIKHKRRSPWITHDIVIRIQARDKVYKKWKKAPTDVHWQEYTVIRNRVKSFIRKAHSEYLWNIGNDNKRLWKYIHSRKGSTAPKHFSANGQVLDDSKEIACAFNKSFAKNFTAFDGSSNSDFNPNLPSDIEFPLSDVSFTTHEVLHLLSHMRSSTATGPDQLPGRILKQCAESITPSLCSIFNMSMSTGAVPEDWRKANVVPVFKKGDRADVGNYRPISLTSIASKLMEKLVSRRILCHLQANDLINENQHGFLPGRSCVTMLTRANDDWLHALEDKDVKQVDCIALDWQKAFDQVSHERLLLKLHGYKIRGDVYKWVQSFLSNRTQCVIYNGSSSPSINVTSGVPQGSVIGPLLFNIFMLDLPQCVSSTLLQYADDSTIFAPIKTKSDSFILQNDLFNISNWSIINKMSLNTLKSQFFTITRSPLPFNNVYSLQGNIIPKFNSIILLGVTITSDLKWNLQTELVRNRASKLLGFVTRNLKGTKPRNIRTAYLSLIRPVITHGIPAWHPTTKANLSKLEAIQNRATKAIFLNSQHYAESSAQRRIACRILSIENFCKEADVKFLHKQLNGSADLNPFHRIKIDTKLRRNNPGDMIIPPRARTSAYQNAFYYRSASVWNSLPADIKTSTKFSIAVRNYFTTL